MWRRFVATATLALLVATACGGQSTGTAGGPADAGTSAGAVPATNAATTANVAILNAAVEKLVDEAFTAASNGDPLGEGDQVRTDDEGLAQLDYADGSLARIGPNTELTIVALAGTTEAVDAAVELSTGRVWSKVQSVTESDGRFEIDTPVGTAAVRGTQFDTQCDEAACTFTVLEGVIEVELLDGTIIRLEAFQRVTVAAEGTAGAVETFDQAAVDADPWLNDNLARDAAQPAAGNSLVGAWRVNRTVTAGGGACEQPGETVWTIDGDATAYVLALEAGGGAVSNQGASATTASFNFDEGAVRVRVITIEMNEEGTGFAGVEQWPQDGCEVEVAAARDA